MSISNPSHLLVAHWPWWLAGAWIGLWLIPLGRIIPGKVLQYAQAPLHEWQGPGGGLDRPVQHLRRIWVPLLNAVLWAVSAEAATHRAPWMVLVWGALCSTLLLLALIDWDTTLLPDWVVVPLGMAGMACSHAGFTQQGLVTSAASAAAVLCLLGGIGWIFKFVRGASGMGGGDIKLLAALAAWLGVVEVLYVVVCASLVTVAWNLAWRRLGRLSRQTEWPFGPAIVIAALPWFF